MYNKSIKSFTLIIFFLININNGFSQQTQDKPEIISSVISFSEIIKTDVKNSDLNKKIIGNTTKKIKKEALPQLEVLDSEKAIQDPFGSILSAKGYEPISTLSNSPSLTFNAIDDNNGGIPPDVNGAVGPSHIMTTLNTQVRIQNLTGGTISTVSLNSFWASLGNPSVFDPKILYEPFNNRWIFTAAANGFSSTSAILIGVSQTNNPTGVWNLYKIDADASNLNWFDYPSLGFNKDWIVVTGNIFTVAAGAFVSGKVYIFKKADLYANVVSPLITVLTPASSPGLCPAATYDNSISSLYVVQRVTGNSGGSGFMNLYSITGAIGSETFSFINQFSTPNPWSGTAPTENSAPQSGSAQKIAANDDRVQNTVYRNGNLWFAHTVFLPAGASTRSSIQWWQINTTGTILQRGRIDDATSAQHYAFPSIAVNTTNDALIGYAKFSSSIFASACYTMRVSTDPINTLQSEFLFKAGIAPYFKTFSGTSNRWGDYTATMTDPTGVDFWTVQEYAAAASGGFDRWGTWWAKIQTCVPSPALVSITANPSGPICSSTNVTFTATPTNPGTTPIYQWKKNGTNVGTNITTYSNNSLISGDQITCRLTSSVSCATGNPATSNIITMTVNVINDGNACTVDVCNTSTGTVSHTPVSVNDGNACTTDACNTSTGAITHTAINIDDGNACTTDACNTSTGVITHTAVNINDGNVCTTDACNTANGNITHILIFFDDGFPCTMDGCNSITGIYHTPVNCGPTLNSNILIQGFYSGSGLMQVSGSGCLNNIDNVSHPDPLDVDTVFISAMNPTFPYAEVFRQAGILKTNGDVTVIFGAAVIINNSYYIKVNHRNSIETWSFAPVQLTAITFYSFSSSSSQSFLANAIATPDNLYFAIYNGDINQDATIDATDFLFLDPLIQNGNGGYDVGDVNGDGSVDATDFLIINPNIILGIGAAIP